MTARIVRLDCSSGLDYKTGTRWIAGALIAGLSISILWGFLKVLLWAAIIGVATWPIYRRFARHLPSSMASNVTPLLFTVLVALVVLGPPAFAFGTLAAHARTWANTILTDANEFVEAAGCDADPAAIEKGDPLHRAIQQAAVMRNEQHGSGKMRQPLLQPQRRLEIKVVGRFIEQQ